MSDARSLKKQFNRMLATLLVALAVAGAVTYAWYIYNANRHITDVKMAAGTGVTFLISNEYDGEYKTNAGLSFAGLLDPVSTDNVLNGFQKVTGFTGGTTQDSLFASMFGAAEHSDYYKTPVPGHQLGRNRRVPVGHRLCRAGFGKSHFHRPSRGAGHLCPGQKRYRYGPVRL